MSVRNETEIQIMRILFKTNNGKFTKNTSSKRAYPFGVEAEYYRKLRAFFKPLIDYVNKYIDGNMDALLRGDSNELEVRNDAIPGKSFRKMIYDLEDYMDAYMPDIGEVPEDQLNNVILLSLRETAEKAKKFGDKEFEKEIKKGIFVSVPISSPWWNDMLKSWAENNYALITSNASRFVDKINNLTEQAIVNGFSHKRLKEELKKATTGLSDAHCKLIARDQLGKLNGQIAQAQKQEIGLNLYTWSTARDDRVRENHEMMEGLLCRYDDADVCSYDEGKTWVDRPATAVHLHPGQDYQCRCVGLMYYPELLSVLRK